MTDLLRGSRSSSRQAHVCLLSRHLRRSGLLDFVRVGAIDEVASVSLEPTLDDVALQDALVRRGWVRDPLPRLRQRTKPFVRWALREPHIGPALHLERQTDGLFVHLDVFSPGSAWWLFPAHLLVDYRGWRSTRMWCIRGLARLDAWWGD